MALKFEDKAHYDVDRSSVVFFADAEGERVRCRVSDTCLRDNFKLKNASTREESIACYLANRKPIQEMAERVYDAHIRDPSDNAVVVLNTYF